MKLVKVDPNSIKHMYRYTKIQSILEEFIQSDAKVVRCEGVSDEYASLSSAHNSYYKSIKRFGYPVITRVIKGERYLIKTEV